MVPRRAWLDELCESRRRSDDGWLPAPIHEVAMRARLIAQRGESPLQAHLRVQTRAGRWLIIHGSYLTGPDSSMISDGDHLGDGAGIGDYPAADAGICLHGS